LYYIYQVVVFGTAIGTAASDATVLKVDGIFIETCFVHVLLHMSKAPVWVRVTVILR
jgi:hypothetical protein